MNTIFFGCTRWQAATLPYPITTYQPSYFVTENFVRTSNALALVLGCTLHAAAAAATTTLVVSVSPRALPGLIHSHWYDDIITVLDVLLPSSGRGT